ncbi:MAG: hypothetical protein LBM77_12725 [Spirochaetaceae bacterium]|jgi:DhnA family fructose-bisphosphate aldolase class Ia|nr:hypothetical protein [Spirochaetaceae bacterium]
MESGLTIRRNQVFRKRDGRAVIIAIDHGGIAGPMPGIEKPAKLIKACVRAGVDGILTTKGFVDASRSEWDRGTGLVLRVTGGFTVLGGGFEEEIIVQPETAAAYGASYAAVTIKFGHKREGEFIKQASLYIDECHKLGIPVMVEAMGQGSLGGKELAKNDPEGTKMAARMAAEIGADMVKTNYTGSPEHFAKVVEGCPVPIVILGGEKDPIEHVFQVIHDSIMAGGKGIAMGRNIWGYPKLAEMLDAVNGLVHKNWPVEKALELLN